MSIAPIAVAFAVILTGQSGLSCQIAGSAVPELAGIDRMMQSFVRDHEAPGAALCLAKDGRILYARGFGWADVDEKVPVLPDSLFRIASVSKPITAVAIIQLCDRGQLALGDRAFEVLGLEDDLDSGSPLLDITISHLLQHSGGWDSGSTFDPLFATDQIARTLQVSPPITQQQIIEFMVGQPLQSPPGTRHAYSNFGYVLLGRVIEARSGQSYEEYVREEVLAPLGITEMRLGGSLPEDRLDAEVTYYDAAGETRASLLDPERVLPLPYTFVRRNSDSAGGWLASAVDLVRFASSLDDPSRCPILSEAAARLLLAPPVGELGHQEDGSVRTYSYGFGWEHRPRGWDRASGPGIVSHDGRIPGSSAILVRRGDGVTWAAVFNRDVSAISGRSLANTLRPFMHDAIEAVDVWPTK